MEDVTGGFLSPTYGLVRWFEMYVVDFLGKKRAESREISQRCTLDMVELRVSVKPGSASPAGPI